jgi:hypothetical protein
MSRITEQDQFPATITVFKKGDNVQVVRSHLVNVDVNGVIHQILKDGAVGRFTRSSTGEKFLKLRWKSKWWIVPTMEEIERWTFDSVCETPDGNIVEHDAPDSWLHLLNLV